MQRHGMSVPQPSSQTQRPSARLRGLTTEIDEVILGGELSERTLLHFRRHRTRSTATTRCPYFQTQRSGGVKQQRSRVNAATWNHVAAFGIWERALKGRGVTRRQAGSATSRSSVAVVLSAQKEGARRQRLPTAFPTLGGSPESADAKDVFFRRVWSCRIHSRP
jgi:hypothetical protein